MKWSSYIPVCTNLYLSPAMGTFSVNISNINNNNKNIDINRREQHEEIELSQLCALQWEPSLSTCSPSTPCPGWEVEGKYHYNESSLMLQDNWDRSQQWNVPGCLGVYALPQLQGTGRRTRGLLVDTTKSRIRSQSLSNCIWTCSRNFMGIDWFWMQVQLLFCVSTIYQQPSGPPPRPL